MLKLDLILFGGRGQSIGVRKRLPDYKNAIAEDKKITGYYLKPGATHYNEFMSAGYTEKDGNLLKKHLLDGLANNEVEMFENKETGYTKGIVYMQLGKGKKKRFKTIWGKSKNDKYYKSVTAYRSDK